LKHTMKNVEFANPSPRFFSGTSMIIAVEEMKRQQYGQGLQVVLGKEDYSKDRNDGFFTRIRRPNGNYPEWAGHYNMTLIEAAVDFATRIGGTGDALQMLHEQVREIKR